MVASIVSNNGAAMKTLYLLSSYQFQHIDFEKACQESPDVHIVLLAHAGEPVPQNARPHIQRVYEIETEARPPHPLWHMSRENILNCIQNDLHQHSPEAFQIFSFDEDYMFISLDIAQQLNATLLSPARPEIFTNKLAMKAHMKAHGIQTPRVSSIDIHRDIQTQFSTLSAALGIPFIVKPTASAGSFDVALIHNLDAFSRYFINAENNTFEYEAEQYIHGTLFHCEFTVFHDAILYEACGQYIHPVMEAKPDRIVGSVMLPETSLNAQKVLSFARQCVRSLPINKGIFHIEIFEQFGTGELYFLEMGFRPPGLRSMNRMADQTLYTYMLRLLLNTSAPEYTPLPSELAYGGGVCPPAHSGTIKKLTQPTHELLKRCTWLKQEGDRIDIDGLRFIRVLDFDSYPGPLQDVWEMMHQIERRDYMQISVD